MQQMMMQGGGPAAPPPKGNDAGAQKAAPILAGAPSAQPQGA